MVRYGGNIYTPNFKKKKDLPIYVYKLNKLYMDYNKLLELVCSCL